MSRESPIPTCPRCRAETTWPLSGDAVFCSACRRWFRFAEGGGIETLPAGWPTLWRPLEEAEP